MKKLLLSMMLLCSLISLNAQSSRYYEVKGYLLSKGYKIANDRYADLREGGTFGYTKTFYHNNEYVIVAFSDDTDVNDVDVYLNYPDGTEYKRDTDTSSFALLDFSPAYSREMRIVVKNYDSDTPSYASRCRLIIAYK